MNEDKLCRKYIDIFYACNIGNKEAIQKFLDSEHSNLQEVLTMKDRRGKTLLHLAVATKNVDIAHMILTYIEKCTLNPSKILNIIGSQDTSGKTVLHEICKISTIRYEFVAIAQEIIELARMLNILENILQIRDHQKMTAFMVGFQEGNVVMVGILLTEIQEPELIKELIVGKSEDMQYDVFDIAMEANFCHIECLKILSQKLVSVSSLSFWDMFMLDTKEKHYDALTRASDAVVKWIISYVVDEENKLIEQNNDNTICNITDGSFAQTFLLSEYKVRDSTCETGKSDTTILEHFQHVGKGHLLLPIFNLHHEKFAPHHESSRLHKYILFETNGERYQRMCTQNNAQQHRDQIKSAIQLMPILPNAVEDERKSTNRQSLLRVMAESECVDLIKHPYTQGYLKRFWYGIGRKYMYFHFFFYVALVVFLVVSVAHRQKFYSQPSYFSCTENNSSVIKPKIDRTIIPFHPNSQITRLLIFLGCLVPSILLLIMEGLQAIAQPHAYWNVVHNYIDILIFVCSPIASAFCVFDEMGATHMDTLVFAQIPLLLLVMWNGAWMFSKTPDWTPPKEESFWTRRCWRIVRSVRLNFMMMLRVGENVVKFLPILFYIGFSFAVAFHYLFPCAQIFSNLGHSVMKIFVMSIGEIDFVDTFQENIESDKSSTMQVYSLMIMMIIIFV